MRIALVAPHAAAAGPDLSRGRGTGMLALAPALTQLGHDVTVYARKDSPTLPAEDTTTPDVTVRYLDAGPAEPLRPDDLAPHIRPLGECLTRCWREDPPDIVHAYSWPGGLAALAAARDLDIPVAVTFHELGVQGSLLRLRQTRDQLARVKLKISLARSVDLVLARSEEERSVLAGLGVRRPGIRVVPWGVDTGHFGPDGPTAARNGRSRLLTLWPTDPTQRPDLLVRVLADVPNAELVIVGGPARKELAGSKLYRELARLAARAQVGDRVTFTGAVGWDDLPPLLRSADLLISTSSANLFDGAALQAMACGTALVAPATGFYCDLVIDGTTGLLMQPGRSAGLARRIRRLLEGPVQLEAFGIAAADRASSRYSWDRIAAESVRAYQRCLPSAEQEPADDAAEELAADAGLDLVPATS
ncbi:MAG TPA: glycosyltransferase [Streptosporangiaceae bacterium]|jgi:glycosyltransferase involved in cell wall biosynthesis